MIVIINSSGYSMQERAQATINLSALFGAQIATWMLCGLAVPVEKIKMVRDLEHGYKVDRTKN